ncbi:hypothetical protein NDU88_003794 [Pleurodeles waltl]|uniref:Uncharacterized protein n=1 Tax=Pleurodeles waltl TaxID=8319 RepID=A0AAV7SGZ8_PLEWA|nr:hypothetical protein NDU88_003794 [Pleurodeles waltl]
MIYEVALLRFASPSVGESSWCWFAAAARPQPCGVALVPSALLVILSSCGEHKHSAASSAATRRPPCDVATHTRLSPSLARIAAR